MIHAAHSNNMSDMGGLRKHMKLTYATFVIGSLALAGVPPFAGFFSKDEIILVAKDSQTYWLGAVLLVGAVITAFYTTRMVLKTFHGEYRGTEHLHESPRSMTAPLVFLAAATCVVGFLGFAPTGAPFMDWVYFGGVPRRRCFSPLVAGISVLAVAIGLCSVEMYKDLQGGRPGHAKLGRGVPPCSSTSTTWTTSTSAASCGRSATRGRPASTGSTRTSSTPR